MKKITSLILALVLTFSLVALSACGDKTTDDKSTAASDDKVITVGASATPHAEILEQIKQALADEGYELKIVTYDDYVLPNQALADGTLDANYFQHKPYLDSFNAKNGTNLVSVGTIHYEPFGIYGNGVTDLKDLAKGATIIIPADDSNETRALFLLQQEGLIKLPDDADAAKGVSTLDIVDDGGYNIVTVQADTVPAQLKNAATGSIAVINGNYALQELNWGADFMDPETWADPFERKNNYNFFCHETDTYRVFQDTKTAETNALIDQYYELVDAAREETGDMNARYEAFAAAESFYIDHAIVVPGFISGGSYQATKLNGFEGQYAMMGQSSNRYKGQHVYKTAMSQDMFDAQYAEWTAAMEG